MFQNVAPKRADSRSGGAIEKGLSPMYEGADCCLYCCFNRANEGRSGFGDEANALRTDEHFCEVRGFEVSDLPHLTFCANHPHHLRHIDVPVGPVWQSMRVDGGDYVRARFKDSPDTEEIRATLVELLDGMLEVPAHPTWFGPVEQFDEAVIIQLGEFGERRALPGLRRVAEFDPTAAREDDQWGYSRRKTVGRAVEAIGVIARDEAIGDLARYVRLGLPIPGYNRAPGDPWPAGVDDPYAHARYFALAGLSHCVSDEATTLIREALNDPQASIARRAAQILAERGDA